MSAASLRQLRSNPLRTLLTLLGVIFGVGAVVAMMSIGEGAERDIVRRIEAMGATTVHVKALPISDAEMPEVISDSAGLTEADVGAIGAALGASARLIGAPSVGAIAWRSEHALGATDLPNIEGPREVRVFGASAALFRAHALQIGAGRALHALDLERARRVVVLGPELARRAFPSGALGQTIRLDYAYFTVVGVLAGRALEGEAEEGVGPFERGPEPRSAIDAETYAMAALIPRSAMVQELAPAAAHHELDMISVQVGRTEQTLAMKRLLDRLLERRHGGVRDYAITAPEELLRQKRETQALLHGVLLAIAAISLLVGGIGVMNIMLATVMERISEIGLRRAIGAKRRDIRRQFLLEAVVLCVVGGLAGVALGLGASFGARWAFGLPAALAWEACAIAFAIATLTGVGFGLMPAVRASKIHPIDALRGEVT